MKNLLFITLTFALLIAFSCKKDEDLTKTTYQIVNENELQTSVDPYFTGALYEVVVFCYDKNGDIIRQDNLDPINPEGGKSELQEVDPECVKVKVSFELLPPISDYYELVDRLYVVAFTNIAKGKNVKIIIDENTMIDFSLKSTKEVGITLKNQFQKIQVR
jgi:hypothetical protein